MEPESSTWKTKLGPHLLYAIIAFVVCSSAWLHDGHIIGGGDQPDWTGTAWAYWWTGYSIEHFQNPFDGQFNYFPLGQQPVAQYNLLDAFLAYPFLKLFGMYTGYNLFATFIVYSSAWGMHILARTAGASLFPALFAGIALETSSFLLLELQHGRLSQAILFFWLVGLSGILKIARGEGNWKLAFGTGVCVAATSLTYWYWGLFLVFAAIPIWFSEIWFWDRKRWKEIGVAIATTLVVCTPYVLALMRDYESLPGVVRELEPWMDFGAISRGDFGLAMGIKQSHWPLWPLFHIDADPDDKRIALMPLLVGLYACFQILPEKKRWVSMLIIGYILTLGPYLKWMDKTPFGIPLPYLFFYDYLPFFQRFWWPQRLELLVIVGLSILAALQMERWFLYLPKSGRSIAIAGIVLILLDTPLRNPYFPVESHPPRRFHERLYAGVKGPIITLPVVSPNEISRHVLWIQTHHKQPILGGLGDHITSHRPNGFDEYVASRTVLKALSEISVGSFHQVTVDPSDVDALLDDGFEWIVVDPANFSPGLEAKWAFAFSSFCTQIWGTPSTQAAGGYGWKITKLHQPVVISDIAPVERLGPRTEEAPPPNASF
jgi:hypothetical protein